MVEVKKKGIMTSMKITIRTKLVEKAYEAIFDGKYPGVRSLSGLVELALTRLLGELDDV